MKAIATLLLASAVLLGTPAISSAQDEKTLTTCEAGSCKICDSTKTSTKASKAKVKMKTSRAKASRAKAPKTKRKTLATDAFVDAGATVIYEPNGQIIVKSAGSKPHDPATTEILMIDGPGEVMVKGQDLSKGQHVIEIREHDKNGQPGVWIAELNKKSPNSKAPKTSRQPIAIRRLAPPKDGAVAYTWVGADSEPVIAGEHGKTAPSFAWVEAENFDPRRVPRKSGDFYLFEEEHSHDDDDDHEHSRRNRGHDDDDDDDEHGGDIHIHIHIDLGDVVERIHEKIEKKQSKGQIRWDTSKISRAHRKSAPGSAGPKGPATFSFATPKERIILAERVDKLKALERAEVGAQKKKLEAEEKKQRARVRGEVAKKRAAAKKKRDSAKKKAESARKKAEARKRGAKARSESAAKKKRDSAKKKAESARKKAEARKRGAKARSESAAKRRLRMEKRRAEAKARREKAKKKRDAKKRQPSKERRSHEKREQAEHSKRRRESAAAEEAHLRRAIFELKREIDALQAELNRLKKKSVN